MDAKKNGNNPAYPSAPDWHVCDQGLTKREAFALAALQGAVNHSEYPPAIAAKHAVAYADALLAELAKEA
jgi:hypothetical protein